MAIPDRTEPAGPGRPEPGPHAPGWYPDLDRGDILRYWDGRNWTERQRPRPAWGTPNNEPGRPWAVSGTQWAIPASTPAEGPVRASSEGRPTAQHRDKPSARGTKTGDEASASAEGAAAAGRTATPDHRGGGGDRGGDAPAVAGGDGPPSTRPRRKWLLFAAAAVLAAIAVGAAGEAMRPKSPGHRVLTDAGYVKEANTECALALPGLRPADSGPFGQAVTPAQTAIQIDQAATGLDGLAGRLRALPAAAVDRPHIDTWLDGWHRYAALGHQYAAFLRQHGNASPGTLTNDTVRVASATDAFALANGLKDCTFFVTPQPDPSNGF